MKLLGSTENTLTKDKNEENVPKVLLVYWNLVNNSY